MDLVSGVSTKTTRQRLKVEGIVQGVGFRPFVYSLAHSLELGGFVLNNGEGVIIEIEGPASRLQTFTQRLRDEPPPLARVEHVASEPLDARREKAFHIVPSRDGAQRNTLVAPDAATCDDCLRELLDPDDRRYLYPFINCTNCGPRFTIILDLPYDRDKTTMRAFPMCPACRAEYEDPLDRRFHAQPNVCPHCGPQVSLQDMTGFWKPVMSAAQHLAQGQIIAIKGLGGYHLACDAHNDDAVTELRRLKQRPTKPFALMVPDLQTARRLCHVNDAEAALLQSRQRPIVLLQRRADGSVAPQVAPGYDTLGLMLPYTPLHSLLFHFYTQATGEQRSPALVMTSGNAGNEPIIYRDDEARQRLATKKTYLLTHNRDIHVRCDDSVTRILAAGPGIAQVQMLRRSRGYAPQPIRLAQPFPAPLLACGAHLKNTFCLGKGNQAFLSQHIGDLENVEILLSYRQAIEHFQNLFDVRPQAVAHDLHPDYLASKEAQEHAAPHKIAVQHHHAHIASVLAEHGLQGPVIGIAADGAGFGPDGAIWGGEILIVDLQPGHEYPGYKRVAHLAYVPLPGGDQAVRQPWRVAVAHLQQAFGPDHLQELDIPFVGQLDSRRLSVLQQMIARDLNTPPTSSLGRLFDAVAALLCLRQEVDYEGQAAIELEILAGGAATDDDPPHAYPFALTTTRPDRFLETCQVSVADMVQAVQPTTIDPAPTIQAIVADLQAATPSPLIAARFHETMAHMLLAASKKVRRQSGLRQVALSGGVFQNRLLLERLLHLLQDAGFETYINREVPPNDGGLSLGQAAVAAARMRSLC